MASAAHFTPVWLIICLFEYLTGVRMLLLGLDMRLFFMYWLCDDRYRFFQVGWKICFLKIFYGFLMVFDYLIEVKGIEARFVLKVMIYYHFIWCI